MVLLSLTCCLSQDSLYCLMSTPSSNTQPSNTS